MFIQPEFSERDVPLACLATSPNKAMSSFLFKLRAGSIDVPSLFVRAVTLDNNIKKRDWLTASDHYIDMAKSNNRNGIEADMGDPEIMVSLPGPVKSENLMV